MAVEAQKAASAAVRPVAPSDREVGSGLAVQGAIDQVTEQSLPEQEPRVPIRERLKTMATEFNPWVITGGYSVLPLLVFAAMGFVNQVQAQVTFFVLPYVREIGVDLATAGILLLVVNNGLAAGGLGIGYFADRYRLRAWFLRGGNIVRTIGGLVSGFAAGSPMYLTGQALAAAGAAGAVPAVSITGDYYPVDVRIRTGFFSTKTTQLALVIGPTFAGLVTVSLGWQWALVIAALLGIPIVALTFLIKEPRQGAMDAPDSRTVTTAQRPVGFAEALNILFSIRTLRWVLIAYPFLAVSVGLIGFANVYFATRWQLGPISRGGVLSAAGAFGILGATLLTPLYRSFAEFKQGRLLSLASILLVVEACCAFGMVVAPNVQVAIAFFMVAGAVIPSALQCVVGLLLAIIPARVRTMGVETVTFMALPAGLYIFVAGPIAYLIFGWAGVSVTQSTVRVAAFVPAMLVAAYFVARASRSVEPDIRSALAAAVAEQAVTEAKAKGADKLLVIRGLEVQVAGAQILYGLNLDVEEGEMVALLGTNGAGKSTLLNAITGVRQAFSGAVFYDGDDTTHVPPHINARDGIVSLPGGHAIFPELSVAENLRAAAWLDRRERAQANKRIAEVLEIFPVLKERLSQTAGSMSGGEQQMLAVSQALLMKPRLLLIDELSMGLAPAIVDQLLRIVRRMNDEGTTVILVEQSVNIALSIAKRVVFMDHGQVLYDGPADKIHEHREIFRSIFLAGAGDVRRAGRRREPGTDEESVLQVEDASARFGGVLAVDSVSIGLKAGEIVGLVGPNGSGKTTLFDLISGFQPLETGSVTLMGRSVSRKGPDARAQIGLGRSFQNVRLFPALTVRENLAVALDRTSGSRSSLAAALWLPNHSNSERRAQRRIDSLIETLGLSRYAEHFIGELSTGTRRIVDIGCVLASAPKVLLLDEPSGGLAQAEVEELGPMIVRVARDLGCAVLVIEHDLGLLASIASRLIVMQLGRVFAEGPTAEVLDNPEVQALLAGAGAGLHRSGDRRALEPLLSSKNGNEE